MAEKYGLTSKRLRTFLGGQSDYEDKGIVGAFKSGMNLNIRKQKDTLSCNQALKDDLALGTMTAGAYFVVPASDGNTYFFCYDGNIYRRNSSGSYLLVYTDYSPSGSASPSPSASDSPSRSNSPSASLSPSVSASPSASASPSTLPLTGTRILGAAEWYDNAGFTYLVWTTPTHVHIKKIIGPGYTTTEPWTYVDSASTGTWPKTNLDPTADWHTVAMANGVLQICNGSKMALIGYDLSYTNDAVALIPGNEARCIVERNKYGIIGCRRADNKDESALFSWDGIGLHWNDKQIIKFGGLNSMIDTEIALAQIGTNGQLYISDFNTPMPFREIRGGGQSNIDGVCSYKGMALVGIYNNTNSMNSVLANGVYSVGRINKNAPLVLNLEYQLTCDEITSVKVVGSDILIAYKLGNQWGVKIVDTANKATAVYQSLDLIATGIGINQPLPNWSRVDIRTQPLPAGCKVEVWYKYDKIDTGGVGDDGWIQANTDPGNTEDGVQFEDTGKQNAVFYVGQNARVMELQLILIPNGNETPEVNEIYTY